MTNSRNQAMRQSIQDFNNLIHPIFLQLFENCSIIATEGNDNPLCKLFDFYSGVDYILVDPRKKCLKGIASRIQRKGMCYRTFTVRKERASRRETEFEKIKKAFARGDFAPTLSIQAYVSIHGDQLLGMAIALTADIWDFLRKNKVAVKHTCADQDGQASFFVISWDSFQTKYTMIEIVPAKNSYLAQWKDIEGKMHKKHLRG